MLCLFTKIDPGYTFSLVASFSLPYAMSASTHSPGSKSANFPEQYHILPEWPNRDDDHLFWVGLNTRFCYRHHPVKNEWSSGASKAHEGASFFCRPAELTAQLQGVLQHSHGGGSILVTGYRGTGKTSLVNDCLNLLEADEKQSWMAVRVNMATITSTRDVLLLACEALMEQLKSPHQPAKVAQWLKHGEKLRERYENTGGTKSAQSASDKQYLKPYDEWDSCIRNLQSISSDLRAKSTVIRREQKQGIDPFQIGNNGDEQGQRPGEQIFEGEALSRSQAKLASSIQEVMQCWGEANEDHALKIVFVFDEVDKLMPVDGWQDDKTDEVPREVKKLASLQQIVAELKYFLSESPSHQIFIAGKDVDDSWAEDQNKGEGIFESIFASNIQVSSIFSLALAPCTAPLPPSFRTADQAEDAAEFYATLAGELGVPRNSMVFCTAQLILPHLAEYEMVQLLTRAYLREPKLPDERRSRIKRWIDKFWGDDEARGCAGRDPEPYWRQPGLRRFPRSKGEHTDWFNLAPTSERTCRRLRTLLEYLTYKGRGIPRKILREFYGLVRPSSCVSHHDPGYPKLWKGAVKRHEKLSPERQKEEMAVRFVLAFPQHHLQKMNFYASIVQHLDQNFALLRGLNDKGKVSIFHIIDYLLKFYPTGFTHRDLEHAPFMTDREELFPSRQLAVLILRLLDGRLWRRKDSRGAEYRMLHHVSHDLGVMFLRHGPEQMELRHTLRDFREELPALHEALKGIGGVTSEQRMAPIHAQMRLGRIMELCGRHHEARLAYYKALRWIRMDVAHFEQSGAYVQFHQSQVMPFDQQQHTRRFPCALAGYLIETHLALGRLLEEVGDLRQALQHYEEANTTFHPYRNSKSVTPKSKQRPEPKEWALAYAKFLQSTLMEGGDEDKSIELASILGAEPPMKPMNHGDTPPGFVNICNHAATTYSKLWERASANKWLLEALVYLDEVGDEYGLVDQIYFIGQVMLRRRDFTAAATWYRAALLKIKAIKKHGEITSEPFGPQTGSGWQTPPALATTEAAIFAALGDITLATSGYAILTSNDDTLLPPKNNLETEAAIWNFIRNELGDTVVGVDDRWEEYFFTRARYMFEADDKPVDARDVYLRQLESRFNRFGQAINNIEASTSREELVKDEYVALNAWTSFWRGARVMTHQSLNAVTSLARDKDHFWGKVDDLRRMGSTLQLVGSMLSEVGLRESAKALLSQGSLANCLKRKVTQVATGQFYSRFLHPTNSCVWSSQNMAEQWFAVLSDLRARHNLTGEGKLAIKAWQSWANTHSRIDVNHAAADLLTIFSYVSDRVDLLLPQLPAKEGFDRVGIRSPLCRINGDSHNETLPVAYIKREIVIKLAKNPEAQRIANHRLRLFALAEKALLSAYLCYRDTIPDFQYAQGCVRIGELYSAVLFTLGHLAKNSPADANILDDVFVAEAFEGLTSYAKRYLVKAINVLDREQEQNRNTFHLMSEAWFNLADILLVRLLALIGTTGRIMCELFSAEIQTKLQSGFQSLRKEEDDARQRPKPDSSNRKHTDLNAEDLRRQITEAYQQGLRYVQQEMNDFKSRYRVPSDVYYSSRNMMDPVLHFRICRAARLRHAAGCGTEFPKDRSDLHLLEITRELNEALSGSESPQFFEPESGTRMGPSHFWAEQIVRFVTLASQVRTDRSPLTAKKSDNSVVIGWVSEDLNELRSIGAQLTLFESIP